MNLNYFTMQHKSKMTTFYTGNSVSAYATAQTHEQYRWLLLVHLFDRNYHPLSWVDRTRCRMSTGHLTHVVSFTGTFGKLQPNPGRRGWYGTRTLWNWAENNHYSCILIGQNSCIHYRSVLEREQQRDRNVICCVIGMLKQNTVFVGECKVTPTHLTRKWFLPHVTRT